MFNKLTVSSVDKTYTTINIMSLMGEKMPLLKKWSAFNKINVYRETDNFGVYELGSKLGIIYIGEGHVRSRLLSHFSYGSDPIVGASHYRVEYTSGKARAVQRQNAELETYKRTYGKYPRYNQRKG